jgi:hypothetical protein
MAEYRIGFAREMSKASMTIVSGGLDCEESQRAALYIALVACEIALKAALEKAGIDSSELKKRRHNLSELLVLFSKCTIAGVNGRRVSASRIRSIVVDSSYTNATIGELLQAEKYGASQFPNQIRYGDILNHFPGSIIARLSEKVVDWVSLYDEITVSQP